MESGVSAEVHFAQKLAANEKKTRDRAIKRLNKYLSARSRHGSGLSESDLLKIWKGLFYCMWMQDKPLIQEELSQRITNLLHCFPKTEDSLRFVKVFLETMSREWNGIDRLRLDKFMMMVRDMLHQTFMLLSKGGWQEDDCRSLALTVYGHVMCAHEARLPDGLKLHLADIFLYELGKVSTEQLTNRAMLILLQPFIEFVLLTNKLKLAHRVVSQIIYKVMKDTSPSSDEDEDADGGDIADETDLMDEDGDIADETDQMDEDGDIADETDPMDEDSSQQKVDHPSFHLDKATLLKLMFDLAGRKVIRASNRALVYKLMKKYSGLWDSNGNCASSAEQTSGVELGESGNEEEHNFVCDLRFLKHDGKAVDQQQAGQQIKKRKKKKKRKNEEHNDGDNISGDIESDVAIDTSAAVAENAVKVKKKRAGRENAVTAAQQNVRPSPGKMIKTSKVPSDRNNSSDGCARATCIVSRKRKSLSDESEDSPAKKKKLKCSSEANMTTSPARKSPKKSSSFAADISPRDPCDEGTLDLDVETDTNSNARPKYRNTSPPKSSPALCPVELVKYNVSSAAFLAKRDTSRLQVKSPSPKARKQPVCSSECSDDRNISEDASLPSEKPLVVNNLDGSVEFKKISPSVEKVRAKSESPQNKFNRKLTPVTSVFQDNWHPAMSVPSGMVMKTPLSIRAEEKASSSGLTLSSKKKVIFDLRRNKANKFQDYLKSLAKQPEHPFEPTKSPAAGILKSPVISPALSSSSSETSQFSSKAGGRRLSAPGNMVNNPGKKKKRSLFSIRGHSQQSPAVGKGKTKN